MARPRPRRAHARTASRTGAVIDASFDTLIANPVSAVNTIIDAHADWVAEHWSAAALDARARLADGTPPRALTPSGTRGPRATRSTGSARARRRSRPTLTYGRLSSP